MADFDGSTSSRCIVAEDPYPYFDTCARSARDALPHHGCWPCPLEEAATSIATRTRLLVQLGDRPFAASRCSWKATTSARSSTPIATSSDERAHGQMDPPITRGSGRCSCA